jgi:hypothetical protein
MLTHAPDAVGQGTWARAILATTPYNAVFYNTSDADGDNFSFNVILPAGTYTLEISALKSANEGTLKVEVDAQNLGTTNLNGLDLLNVVTITGIILSAGKHVVKCTAGAVVNLSTIRPTVFVFTKTA